MNQHSLKYCGWLFYRGVGRITLMPLLSSIVFFSSIAFAGETSYPISSATHQQSAVYNEYASQQMLLALTNAGDRIVAVGEHGNIVLSDDNGHSFRLAQLVPTRTTLTAVSFVDARNGWAVGQWGTILHSQDGGETWQLQRSDIAADRPLFSVFFLSKTHGFAVGLWSLILETKDGGSTWSEVVLPVPPDGGRADRNLFQIFSDGGARLFIAAEKGTVLTSADAGATWEYLNTGYSGSFWTGTVMNDGTIVVAGLRGSVYRSTDNGRSWTAAKTDNKSSITEIHASGGTIRGVGLDGVDILSTDHGVSFSMTQRSDRLAYTALLINGSGKEIKLSKRGVIIN